MQIKLIIIEITGLNANCISSLALVNERMETFKAKFNFIEFYVGKLKDSKGMSKCKYLVIQGMNNLRLIYYMHIDIFDYVIIRAMKQHC